MLNQITLACYTQGHQNQFINSETFSVAELYCSKIKNLDTKKVKKVNVNIQQDWGDLLNYYENYTDVITVRIHFDFITYSKSNQEHKKRMQLEAIHYGMLKVAKHEGWDIDILNNSYNHCLEDKLKYQSNIGTPKLSPDKKHKISFWFNWDIDIIEVFWILYDLNDDELGRDCFLKKESYEGEFIYYTKWKWIDNKTILFEDKYKYGNHDKWEIKIR